MMKKTLLTAAAAMLLVAGAAQAQGTSANANVKADTGIGSAIGNTADAAYQKSAEGVNAVKGAYHENMADMNAKASRENLAKGDFGAAATDAKDAAKHQASAMEAKAKENASKTKAGQDWAKAKAAVSTSATTR